MHPEDTHAAVLVGIFRVSTLRLLRFGVLRVECIGNVLEEDQAEDDMLVFRRVLLLRSASADAQRLASNPRFAVVSLFAFC